MAKARFYGLISGRAGEATREGSKDSGLKLTGRNANGDIEVYMGVRGNGTWTDDTVSVSIRDHDTGSMGVTLYQGGIAALLKGGRMAAMEYLIEGASKAEKVKLATLLANKALREQFDKGDAT